MALAWVTSIVSSVLSSFVQLVAMPLLMPLVEANLMPDFLIRFGIRTLLSGQLASLNKGSVSQNVAAKLAYVKDLKTRTLAEHTADANRQHYEVPADFYTHSLGDWRKYSCGYWGASAASAMTLTESEEAALALVAERAQLPTAPARGRTQPDAAFHVLDMGCGWGSASLYIATHFPHLQVTGVSNSASQREYIMDQARRRGLKNVNIITCDINTFAPEQRFDRVISIEMMEHVKNYELLLSRVASWLKPGGKMFVHIFTHHSFPFHYTDGWMAENFFTGGQMPSDDLLLYFQKDLALVDHWVLNGKHYERTCNAWLAKMDANASAALEVCERTYGRDKRLKWFVNWRLFYMACAELFGYADGEEWAVSHYLFEKKA